MERTVRSLVSHCLEFVFLHLSMELAYCGWMDPGVYSVSIALIAFGLRTFEPWQPVPLKANDNLD